MKGFISTTFFGFFNYILAILMMTSPWLFGFVQFGGAALFFPFMFGWYYLLMAIFSITKGGMVRIFPIQMHCTLLTIAGFVIMMSPFLYGFSHLVWQPHVVLGAIALFVGLFTVTSPLTCPPDEMHQQGGIGSTDALESRLSH